MLTSGVVFRIGKHALDHPFYAKGRIPDPEDFELNSSEEDRMKGVDGGDGIAAISVWDWTLTDPATVSEDTGKQDRLVLTLAVDCIMSRGLTVASTPSAKYQNAGKAHCDLGDLTKDK